MAYIIIKIGGEECIVSICNKFIIGWVSDMLALKILRLATVGLWTYLQPSVYRRHYGGVELPRWFWNLGTLLGFQASWKNFSSASPWLWGRSQWCWILRDGTRYQIHKQLVVFLLSEICNQKWWYSKTLSTSLQYSLWTTDACRNISKLTSTSSKSLARAQIVDAETSGLKLTWILHTLQH